MLVNCFNCNKEFNINPSRAKNKTHHCSRQCLGVTSSKLQSKKVKTNCTICNNEIFYKQSHFKQIAQPTCSRKCVSALKKIRNKGELNPRALNLNKFEKFFHDRCKGLKLRADAKKIDFNLTREDLIDLYNKQDGKCYYTNLPMSIEKRGKVLFDSLSVDRFNSDKGYTKDNIVLCLNCINMMKSDTSYDIIKIVFEAIYLKEKQNASKV